MAGSTWLGYLSSWPELGEGCRILSVGFKIEEMQDPHERNSARYIFVFILYLKYGKLLVIILRSTNSFLCAAHIEEICR